MDADTQQESQAGTTIAGENGAVGGIMSVCMGGGKAFYARAIL